MAEASLNYGSMLATNSSVTSMSESPATTQTYSGTSSFGPDGTVIGGGNDGDAEMMLAFLFSGTLLAVLALALVIAWRRRRHSRHTELGVGVGAGGETIHFPPPGLWDAYVGQEKYAKVGTSSTWKNTKPLSASYAPPSSWSSGIDLFDAAATSSASSLQSGSGAPPEVTSDIRKVAARCPSPKLVKTTPRLNVAVLISMPTPKPLKLPQNNGDQSRSSKFLEIEEEKVQCRGGDLEDTANLNIALGIAEVSVRDSD